jgi:hypothetical protein
MRENSAQDAPNRAHIFGIFGLLSQQPRRILHYIGIYQQQMRVTVTHLS